MSSEKVLNLHVGNPLEYLLYLISHLLLSTSRSIIIMKKEVNWNTYDVYVMNLIARHVVLYRRDITSYWMWTKRWIGYVAQYVKQNVIKAFPFVVTYN